jgi:hypothetical protein
MAILNEKRFKEQLALASIYVVREFVKLQTTEGIKSFRRMTIQNEDMEG